MCRISFILSTSWTIFMFWNLKPRYSTGANTIFHGKFLHTPNASRALARIGAMIALHCCLVRFSAGSGYAMVLHIVDMATNHTSSLVIFPAHTLSTHCVAIWISEWVCEWVLSSGASTTPNVVSAWSSSNLCSNFLFPFISLTWIWNGELNRFILPLASSPFKVYKVPKSFFLYNFPTGGL